MYNAFSKAVSSTWSHTSRLQSNRPPPHLLHCVCVCVCVCAAADISNSHRCYYDGNFEAPLTIQYNNNNRMYYYVQYTQRHKASANVHTYHQSMPV